MNTCPSCGGLCETLYECNFGSVCKLCLKLEKSGLELPVRDEIEAVIE